MKGDRRKRRSKREILENIHQPYGVARWEGVSKVKEINDSTWQTGPMDREVGH